MREVPIHSTGIDHLVVSDGKNVELFKSKTDSIGQFELRGEHVEICLMRLVAACQDNMDALEQSLQKAVSGDISDLIVLFQVVVIGEADGSHGSNTYCTHDFARMNS